MDNEATEVRVESVKWWLELLKKQRGGRNFQNIGKSFIMMRRPTEGAVYYRGQQNSDWSLETTLERFCREKGVDWRDEGAVAAIESKMLNDFMRKAPTYIKDGKPRPISALDWCMKMRHYGLPSRMLDVSLNHLTALYFACWKGKGDFAVWEFHDDLLNWSATKRAEQSVEFIPANFYIDDRVRLQEGAFIKQNRIGRSFSEAISETLGICSFAYMRDGGVLRYGTLYGDVVSGESKIVKWVFPGEMRREAKEIIKNNNHFGETLFPDVFGMVETIIEESI